MNGYQFERAFVELIAEISYKKGFKAKPIAEKAWPHRKDAGTKWRKIRNGDPPQELSMRDAYDLVRAMGLSITDICGAVQSKALDGSLELSKHTAPEKKEAQACITPNQQMPAIETNTTYEN